MKPVIVKAPPPVAERPKCPNCARPLLPLINAEKERRPSGIEGGFTYVTVSSIWTGEYKGYGAFCTMRCCVRFANAAHEAGFKRRR